MFSAASALVELSGVVGLIGRKFKIVGGTRNFFLRVILSLISKKPRNWQKKKTNWRLGVKLLNFCQFWTHILRWTLPCERKFSWLSDFFENFRNFFNFWILKWPFWRNGQKYWQLLFVIFCQVDFFYILVEFEVDGMRPNEFTKNGRKGAHGLNSKIFRQFLSHMIPKVPKNIYYNLLSLLAISFFISIK